MRASTCAAQIGRACADLLDVAYMRDYLDLLWLSRQVVTARERTSAESSEKRTVAPWSESSGFRA